MVQTRERNIQGNTPEQPDGRTGRVPPSDYRGFRDPGIDGENHLMPLYPEKTARYTIGPAGWRAQVPGYRRYSPRENQIQRFKKTGSKNRLFCIAIYGLR
jgi:hypothetical protein